jgi:putative ABC transport system permease protein
MKLLIKNIIILLTRFRMSSILTITGLAVAYAVFYMIVVQAHYDFSFDRNFEKSNSIFLYSRIIPNVDFLRTKTNVIEANELLAKYSEIKNVCYLYHGFLDERFDIKDDGIIKIENVSIPLTYTNAGFVDIFQPKILAGDAGRALTPDNAMLTESIVKQYFGNENPIGKTFFFHKSDKPITIAAVCADFPDNCRLKNGIYFSLPETDRSMWNYTTYLEINSQNKDRLLNALNKDQAMQKGTNFDGQIWQYELTALPDIHLGFPAEGKGSLTTIISLLAIGILLLIISYINFLNFSIALAPVRIKSFNIRRILGESSLALKFSIVMEAVFLSFIAFLVSILIVNFLNTGAVQDFFKADLSVSRNLGLLIVVGGISLFTGFLAGIYPAFYATSFKPAMALSGSFSISGHTKWLKNILIIFQFVTAIFLIIVTLFVKIQHDYLLNKNVGINTENILYLKTAPVSANVEDFIYELNQNPDITDVTSAQYYPGYEQMQIWGRDFQGVKVLVNVWYIKPDFLDFFGINIVDGRKFEKNENHKKMIFNEAFLKEYQFDNIIGQMFGSAENPNENFEIVGIAENFNFKSLHESIKPLAFVPVSNTDVYNSYYKTWTFVKTIGANTSQTIDFIRNTWKKFSSEPVEVLFLDKTISELYKKENNLAKLVSTCGIIAIIVAIMGLYGLILFNAKSKRKNIAIRKINGATRHEIIMMLNHNLLIQFVIAYIISVPVAGYVVNRWLEGFAYKTPMYWWVFILGGLIVLIISLITVSWESYKAASANPIKGILDC